MIFVTVAANFKTFVGITYQFYKSAARYCTKFRMMETSSRQKCPLFSIRAFPQCDSRCHTYVVTAPQTDRRAKDNCDIKKKKTLDFFSNFPGEKNSKPEFMMMVSVFF